jgi:hypothetical protein
MPAFWNGASSIPPATGINYASWFAVAFVFQFFMRRRHFRWWMRYNYSACPVSSRARPRSR